MHKAVNAFLGAGARPLKPSFGCLLPSVDLGWTTGVSPYRFCKNWRGLQLDQHDPTSGLFSLASTHGLANISCGRISCHLQIHAGKLAGLFLFCNTSREECFRKRKKNKKEKEEKRRRMFQHFPFNSVGGRPCARGHAVVQKKMKPFFENYPIPSRALVCSARAVRTAGPRPGRTGRLAPAIRRRRATSALPPAKPVGSSSRSARLPALRFCVFFQKTWQKNKSW